MKVIVVRRSLSPNTRFRICALMLTATVVASAFSPRAVAAASVAGAVSTVPPGITLLPVTGPAVPTWRTAIGTSDGLKAYYFTGVGSPNLMACEAPCNAQWRPVMALPNARSGGEWRLLGRRGEQQWAYLGKPLYYLSVLSKDAPKIPPEWKEALFEPTVQTAFPPGIGVGEVFARGVSLTDARGHTLYVGNSDARAGKSPCLENRQCARQWRPMLAPNAATALGDIGVMERADGARQWSYRNKPLFAFEGDRFPGEMNGLSPGSGMAVAFVAEYFIPAGVTAQSRLHGPTLVDPAGRTLYMRLPYAHQVSGFDLLGGLTPPYGKGKDLGARGCDADCLKEWKPFLAPENSQPSGYWEIVVRPEGTKQWMYKGYALYTFTGDVAAGDVNGNNRWDLVHGDGGPYSVAEGGGGDGAALFWHVATP